MTFDKDNDIQKILEKLNLFVNNNEYIEVYSHETYNPHASGRNPLHYLAYEIEKMESPWEDKSYARDIVMLSQSEGADINKKDENGFTPLHYVRNPYLVKILLEGGASINLVNNDGLTPLAWVIKRQAFVDEKDSHFEELVNKFIEMGGKIESIEN